MMRVIKKSMVLLVAFMFMFGLTACGEKRDISTAVVVGVHSNSPVIALNSDSLRDTLYEVCYYHGKVTFVNVDGDPQAFFSTKIPENDTLGLSDHKKNEIANNYLIQLETQLENAQADNPEVDTLEAIRIAAQSLKGTDGEKVMLIMDSGLQTTSYLNFTKGYLNASPESIVQLLDEKNALVDLQGIDVYWSLLGETSFPQESLSVNQKKELEDIWTAILKASGAKSINFMSDLPTAEAYEGLPDVSLVDAEEEFIEMTDQSEKEDLSDDVKEKSTEAPVIARYKLDSTKLQFVGDKAEFVDVNSAKETIKDIANKLIEHPDAKIFVIGSTASGNDKDFLKLLSSDRADAVKNLMIEMGVNDDQVISFGLADEDPWHIDDQDESGYQIETFAAQNRKVVIMDINDPEAEQFR